MTTPKKIKNPAKPKLKPRPLHVCALSATILGRLRVTTIEGYTSHQLTLAFPNFNVLEMAHAIHELVEKRLLKQKGADDHAVYALTDEGREARITIS